MTTSRTKKIVVCALAAAALGLSLYKFLARPMRYNIPDGFKGWIILRFNVPSCPQLPTNGVFLLVNVAGSGRGCTSNNKSNKLTLYSFNYIRADGTRQPLIWNEHGKPGVQVWMVGYDEERSCEMIFVGDESSLNQSGAPPPCT